MSFSAKCLSGVAPHTHRGWSLPYHCSQGALVGKDGELPVEDDVDLSDVELDDLEKDEL